MTFMIPGPLRELAGNRSEVQLQGSAATVSEALALLWASTPAVRDRVLNERGAVRPHVHIFVDGESIRDSGGLASPIRDGARIFILPAVSGG
ncbi:MAG: ubiquitin-like small modifier protein 1 [Acidobacteriota bacterium]